MRGLHRRLDRLEKLISARPPTPCDLCGAPKGYIASSLVRDPQGRPIHPEYCPRCGIETCGGRAIDPIDPTVDGYIDVLVLPAPSPPLPV
ncbi:MAG: hypothetical protein IT436_12105 [Phycisphaerales bacterium]|nr:hypothetical protein [Phycisphaerales bacterium]